MRTRILFLFTVVALLASSCVLTVAAKPSLENPAGHDGRYKHPNFAAEMIERPDGAFIVSISANQYSPEIDGAVAVITINGREVVNANVQASAGTFQMPHTGFVEVRVHWREANELLWAGWIHPS